MIQENGPTAVHCDAKKFERIRFRYDYGFEALLPDGIETCLSIKLNQYDSEACGPDWQGDEYTNPRKRGNSTYPIPGNGLGCLICRCIAATRYLFCGLEAAGRFRNG